MSTFIRPPLRRKVVPAPFSKPEPGTFLYEIIKSDYDGKYTRQKDPVYQQESYLKALKTNYEYWGLDYKDPELPPTPEYIPPETVKEPYIPFADHVQVTMNILKSGKVRIKINPCMYEMYQKYWKNGEHPPQKTMIKNLKSLGFSERFIERVENNYKKIPARVAAFEKCIERVFNKPSVPKAKPKKKKTEPEPEDDLEIEEDDDDHVQEEDFTMDVEVDPDDEDEAVNEEEFIDDD
jgi:hypothetical protein